MRDTRTGKGKRVMALVMAVVLFLGAGGLQPMTAEAKGADIETLLNSIPLTPTFSEWPELNELEHAVLDAVTTPQMTTYEKVKAVYDFIIAYGEYATGILYYDFEWSWDENLAYSFLDTGVGVCDQYNTAFMLLMKAIGIQSCRTVGGEAAVRGGGWNSHLWSVICINGVDYVFDPQIEDSIAARNGGAVGYYRFGKTYDQMQGQYRLAGEESVLMQVHATKRCSIWSAPATAEENRVKYVEAGYEIQVYPEVVYSLLNDGKEFYRTVKGNYVLCNCVERDASGGLAGDIYQEYATLANRLFTPGMSEYDKVKAAHDWLVLNCQFDLFATEAPDVLQSAEGPIRYGKAQSAGYSQAFLLLMNLAGVEANIIHGTAPINIGDQYWNQVKIDGQWYHIDVAWDDPFANAIDHVDYTYFLLSDQAMYRNHAVDAGAAVHSCPSGYGR